MGRSFRAVPRVALETAFLTTGLPEDVRLATAQAMARSVRERGAEAAFAGVVGGTPVVGIDDTTLEGLASAGRKLATRDLPIAVAERADGGTTVSATLFLAHRAGVGVAATGGIGGVHRSGSTGAGGARDESADQEACGKQQVPRAFAFPVVTEERKPGSAAGSAQVPEVGRDAKLPAANQEQ